jgi:hypothetical protein
VNNVFHSGYLALLATSGQRYSSLLLKLRRPRTLSVLLSSSARHTLVSNVPLFGLVLIGTVETASAMLTKNGHPGDILIQETALGNEIIISALKRPGQTGEVAEGAVDIYDFPQIELHHARSRLRHCRGDGCKRIWSSESPEIT